MRQVFHDRILRTLLAVFVAGAAVTCRDAGITGPGRIAPASARLLVAPAFATNAPDVPIAAWRTAHVQLFTVPAGTLARDDTITVADGDTTTSFSVDVTVTTLDQRFLLALDLLDDHGQLVYSARDTVTAWVPGSTPQPPPTPVALNYAGQDTAAHRLVISPRDTTLSTGTSTRFSAVARRADGTPVTGATVRFSSRGPGVTVDADGTVHATGATTGGTMVVARLATGLSDSTTVTVAAAPVSLTLAPDTATLRPGTILQLDARLRDAQGSPVTGPAITFSSAAPTVASVSGSGLVTALRPGTAVITARAGTLAATSTILVATAPIPPTVRIAPRGATVLANDSLRFTATVRDSLGQPTALVPTWTVAPATLATVDPVTGLLRATRAGTVLLVARAGGSSDTLLVPVRAAASLVIAPASLTFTAAGQRARFTATVRDSAGATIDSARLAWSVGDTVVASLDTIAAQSVVALARRTGSTTVTASGGGLRADAALTVGGAPAPSRIDLSPTSATLSALGELLSISATVRDANGVALAVTPAWASRDTTVASVDAGGVVRARGNGATWIVATAGSASDSALVRVRQAVDSVVVSRDTIALALGDTTTIVVTLLDRNRNVITDLAPSFSSGDPSIVAVTAAGQVTLLGPGAARVTASAGGHEAITVVMQGQGTTGVTASLGWIRITPGGGSVRMGGTLPLVAELVDASGAATPISPSWASDQPGRAPVSAGGIVTLVDTTTVTITATSQGIAGHATFSVRPAPAVTSFGFAPTTLSGASTTTLRFSVSVGGADPGDGISSVDVEFTGPGGVTRGCTASTPTSGTARRGTWDCVVSLPAGSPTGSWHATRVSLAGTVPGTVGEDRLSALGPTVLTVLP